MNNTLTVSCAPGSDARRPMIRIANRWLTESGFIIGSQFDVNYAENVITLKKLNTNYEFYNNIQTAYPVPISTGETNVEESTQHTG